MVIFHWKKKPLHNFYDTPYILAYVFKEGYNGSISNLSDYITMVAKNNNRPVRQA